VAASIPTGSRPGRRWALALVPGVAVGLLALSAAPFTHHYDWSELSRREAEIRECDRRVREGLAFWTCTDEASYYAMTLAPLSDSYLARRQPYAYRILGPLLAYLPVKAGASFTAVYFAFAVIGLAVAGLFIVLILQRLGINAIVAVTGGLLFVFITKASNPLDTSHEIDPGLWALLFGAWYCLLGAQSARAVLLLSLAVLWRDTAILSLPAVAIQAWVRPKVRGIQLALLVLLPSAAFLAPRVLIESSNSIGLSVLFDWGATHARGNLLALFAEYLHGWGISLALAPFGFAAMRRDGLWPMLLLLPTYAIGCFPLEIGRLVVPASLACLVSAAYALATLSQRPQRLLCAVMVAGSVGALLAWRLESGSTWVLAAASAVVGVGFVATRRARSLPSGGG
jgi:hypothetical protein